MQIGAVAGNMALNGRLDAQRVVQGIKEVANPGDRLDLDHVERSLEACKKAAEDSVRNDPPVVPPGLPMEPMIHGLMSMYETSWMMSFLAAAKGFLVLQYVDNDDTEDE